MSNESRDEEAELMVLIDRCLAVVPDSEDFSSLLAEAAQNAAIAVVYSLMVCHEGLPDASRDAAKKELDSVETYLTALAEPDFGSQEPKVILARDALEREDQLLSDPLVVLAIADQQRDLSELSQLTQSGHLSDGTISAFRAKARTPTKSLMLALPQLDHQQLD